MFLFHFPHFESKHVTCNTTGITCISEHTYVQKDTKASRIKCLKVNVIGESSSRVSRHMEGEVKSAHKYIYSHLLLESFSEHATIINLIFEKQELSIKLCIETLLVWQCGQCPHIEVFTVLHSYFLFQELVLAICASEKILSNHYIFKCSYSRKTLNVWHHEDSPVVAWFLYRCWILTVHWYACKTNHFINYTILHHSQILKLQMKWSTNGYIKRWTLLIILEC